MVMLFSFTAVHAQVTDTLKGVEIKDEKPKTSNDERINTYSQGQLVYAIDTVTLKQYQFQSMANLLSQQVPVFVKSYGINNVATLNFRGASAAQSQVYWNGIPISNAALGISDVSLLPVSLMNKVNVIYGSSSALWGSGNVGGALLVENDLPDFDTGAFSQSISAVMGSFGNYRAGLKSALSTNRFVASANVFGQTMNNDFRYKDADDKEQTMTNAKMQSGVGLLQAGYKLNDKNTLSFRGWYQQYYREIPPALFESASAKNQRDESLRLLLNWKRNTDKSIYYAKAAYIRDFMWYRDSLISVESKNITDQVYVEAGIKRSTFGAKDNNYLMIFIPVQLSRMDRLSVGDTKTQSKYALAAAYARQFGTRVLLSAQSRAEVVDNNGYILPGINATYLLHSRYKLRVTLRANVQRTYRVPTLNELYYSPGGNPNLKPEKGWNEDVGYSIVLRRSRGSVYHATNDSLKTVEVYNLSHIRFEHDLSVYNRVINDWILWFGGAIWTPHNISQVHSRGLQTENALKYVVNKNLEFKLGVNGSYTLATTMSSYIPNDGSIGKQIPYTPRFMAQSNIGFKWKDIYLNYNHTYTGVRYITTDESYGLKEYTLGNIQLLYAKDVQGHILQLTAQCNNVWNSEYVVVNARPMPGINWLVGLSFTFSTP